MSKQHSPVCPPTPEQAIVTIKQHSSLPEPEACPLNLASGGYLAADCHASFPLPRATNSAVDGYAVRWADLQTPPTQLEVIGASRAGHPYSGHVGHNQAVLIATGALLPQGADTVLPTETIHEQPQGITLQSPASKGQYIRYAGESFVAGTLLLPRGQRISAGALSLLASAGVQEVSLSARSKVALIITGSELVCEMHASDNDAQIPDCSMLMLSEAVTEAGGQIVSQKRIKDDREMTVQAVNEAFSRADIIICTGGSGRSRHDHVHHATASCGFRPLFTRIQQHPGGSLLFAMRERTKLFSLPGSPLSSHMQFMHYIRPVISAESGHGFGWPQTDASLAESLENRRDLTVFVQVTLRRERGTTIAIPIAAQNNLLLLASSCGYILLPPGQNLQQGDQVTIFLYSSRRETQGLPEL